ncbi:MAG: flagellin [Heliobacteriaceae bacterium]|nr:flagellin [Heliobacteriaceae bacterium]
MRINHNIQALNAYRQLAQNQNVLSRHLEKLSSGLRINRASDDAAGLAISEKMRSQIRGLAAAERNALDGISLIQTAEGAMDSVHQMLQRMRELAVQAANGTYAELDRNALQSEVNQLLSEINRIGNTTEFNTRTLLNGDLEAAKVTKFVGNPIDLADLRFATLGTPPFFSIEVEGESSTNIVRIDIPQRDYRSISELAVEIERSLNTKLNTDLEADNEIKVSAAGDHLEIINDINGRDGKVFRIYNRIIGATDKLGLYGATETEIKPDTGAVICTSDALTPATIFGVTKAANYTPATAGDLILNINGETVTVNFAATAYTAAEIEAAINAAIASPDSQIVVDDSGTNLTFSTLKNGKAGSIEVDSGSTAAVLTAFGLTAGSAAFGTSRSTAEIAGGTVTPAVNITAATNTLEINVDGTTYTATLTVANYAATADMVDLAADIQTQVNAAITATGGTATVSVKFDGAKLLIKSNTVGSTSQITIGAGTNLPAAAGLTAGQTDTTLYTITPADNTLNLKIDGEELSVILPNGTYDGEEIANLLETGVNSSLRSAKNVNVTYDGDRLVICSGEAGYRSEVAITSGTTALNNLGIAIGMRSPGTAPRLAEVTSQGFLEKVITINASVNDQLQVVVDGEPITAVIPAGIYRTIDEMQQLAAAIETKINDATSTAADVTVSFNGSRFIITSGLEGSGSELRIRSGSAGDGSETLGLKAKWDTGSNHDAAINMQLGANEGQTMGISLGDIRSRALGLTVLGQTEGFSSVNNVTDGVSQITIEKAFDLTDFQNAAKAITLIDTAINTVSIERSKLGAMQNRLEHTVNNLRTFNENLTASDSRIRDADMALEMTEYTKNNIIMQAATAMLAQANQLPQGILQLLK